MHVSKSIFFWDYKKLNEPVGREQFVILEKFTTKQIAGKKIDYLLIIYKWQFLSRFSILGRARTVYKGLCNWQNETIGKQHKQCP